MSKLLLPLVFLSQSPKESPGLYLSVILSVPPRSLRSLFAPCLQECFLLKRLQCLRIGCPAPSRQCLVLHLHSIVRTSPASQHTRQGRTGIGRTIQASKNRIRVGQNLQFPSCLCAFSSRVFGFGSDTRYLSVVERDNRFRGQKIRNLFQQASFYRQDPDIIHKCLQCHLEGVSQYQGIKFATGSLYSENKIV